MLFCMGRSTLSAYHAFVTTRKYKLTLAYDGTSYEGWQARKDGLGIRATLARALESLCGSAPEIIASSRTDAGVHARGLVAHIELPATSSFTGPGLRLALNAKLPDDIRVMSARIAPARFHARFDVLEKEYRYQVWNHPVMDPLLRHQAWHVPRPLELASMKEAAAHFIGRHDFRHFTVMRKGELLDSHRTLTQCRVIKQGKRLTIQLTGEGFLYKMCRRIVGTLVQVGEGKLTPSEVHALLHSPAPHPGGFVAPAHGLMLWRVGY